ncbi:MAG TPA: allantoinase AllB [Candidatus Xenobia bacterium]|nr:allantoinase AllB [Candidatus Xenobia bacterium]
MTAELIVRGRRVLTAAGVQPAAIHIHGGKIAALATYSDIPPGAAVFDAGERLVMPGVVDTHVHINEPGRTQWEGFETATRAATAGGVTTLVEMPLNSIPATTTRAALETKLAAARDRCWVDVGCWGGLVPGNAAELRSLFEAGAFGFKCFLVPSGVPEFEPVTETDLRAALPELASLGAVLLAHAELPEPIEAAAAGARNADARRYATWLASRPRQAENRAIALLIWLSREFGARIHIVHLSSSEALPLLREAKQEGLPITVETCHHYLTFAAEEIPDGATEFKCAPPIRERDNREKLWAALGDGLIDFVATDHSPCPPAMKERQSGDFLRAWGGIASLQLSLPALWTQARRRGFGVERLAQWLCSGPARLAGLDERKGKIAVGYDADLVVWDPETEFEVAGDELQHRHKLTPYGGHTLHGRVEATFLRGEKIYERGRFAEKPSGAVLRRGP